MYPSSQYLLILLWIEIDVKSSKKDLFVSLVIPVVERSRFKSNGGEHLIDKMDWRNLYKDTPIYRKTSGICLVFSFAYWISFKYVMLMKTIRFSTDSTWCYPVWTAVDVGYEVPWTLCIDQNVLVRVETLPSCNQLLSWRGSGEFFVICTHGKTYNLPHLHLTMSEKYHLHRSLFFYSRLMKCFLFAHALFSKVSVLMVQNVQRQQNP